MMRSMFSGVSGLKAHQTRMDVIGNNIANVNTIGFKSGRATFQEIFSQTLRGAGAPDSTSGRGGTNPMQVGLGLGVGSVDTIMTRGSTQRTDNPTDLSIEGEGFFIVKGGNNGTPMFSRAGNFAIDEMGNLHLNGMNVQGWMDYDLDTKEFSSEGELVGINLYKGGPIENKRIIPPSATNKIELTGNLFSEAYSVTDYNNANDPDIGASANVSDARTAMQTLEDENEGSTFRVPVTVFDKLGNAHDLKLSFFKDNVKTNAPTPPATSPTLITSWRVFVDSGSTSGTALGTVSFDENGEFLDSTLKQISIDKIDDGTDAFTVDVDLSGLSNYSADYSAKADVNGYSTGNISTFNIGPDGIITGIYSNGQQQPLGMIALASFPNPGGLLKAGQNLYTPSTNSGEFSGKGQKPGSLGVGMLNPGTLEMSNVDLSREFTDMIVTQRGFQANSRIITTSDEMLQELVNLKR
jgi:flagellar hook protein FlgE